MEDEEVTMRNGNRTNRKSLLWRFFGKRVPRGEAVFVCQIIIIYTVIAVALYNLTRNERGSQDKLWIALLGSCLGYILPNPTITQKKEDRV